MSTIKQFLMALGNTIDLSRKIDFDRYLPKEWRGKTIEQRAEHMIAESFQEGIRQTKIKRPELSNGQEKPFPSAQHAH